MSELEGSRKIGPWNIRTKCTAISISIRRHKVYTTMTPSLLPAFGTGFGHIQEVVHHITESVAIRVSGAI